LKISKEIKTAVLVISSILLFIWGYSFLKGRDLFVHYKTLFVQYDNIEGLVPSAPITLNGLIVGKVLDFKIDNKSGKVNVQLQINSDFPISKTSVAELYAPSPIGGKQIAIIPDLKNETLAQDNDYLVAGNKLGITDELAQQLVPIKTKIEKLVDNANVMLLNVNDVLDAQLKQNLKNSLASLNATLAQFSIASKSVNGILATNDAKINSSLANVDKMTKNFATLSDSLSKINIGKTAKNLDKTMASVDKMISNLNGGKGTMGKMLNDDTMYKNLTKTSKELELLLQDVRLYPTRYVNVSLFGKKNKPYLAPAQDSIYMFKK
jgi:phospholipid/cholesterol/gamma-HCH transport system substrate-binding protein